MITGRSANLFNIANRMMVSFLVILHIRTGGVDKQKNLFCELITGELTLQLKFNLY